MAHPIIGQKSTRRKQWTLLNRTQNRYNHFGSYLAEDGWPDSQVDLAKQLLNENCEDEKDQEENASLGVYWLIKASSQGHKEATELLKQCLDTGKGITEHNWLDVKVCLETSQEDKIIQKTAHEIFDRMSAGEDFITSDQLKDELNQACSSTSNDSDIIKVDENLKDYKRIKPSRQDWKSRINESGEKLTEDVLLNAAKDFSRGQMPIVQKILTIEENKNHVSTTCDLFLQPVYIIHNYNLCLQERLNKRFSKLTFNPFSYFHAPTLLTTVLCFILGIDGIYILIPYILFYGSLLGMVVATVCALCAKRDYGNFHRWSNLFILYSGGSLSVQEAEYQYLMNTLKPYVFFFVSLGAHLFLKTLIDSDTMFQSELTIVSICMTFYTLYSFSLCGPKLGKTKNLDLIALLSFCVNVLAKYPYETDTVVSKGWRFLDLHVPTFASYVIGNGVEFCLNFRALFYLILPAIMVKMAARNNWRGIYTDLIPHCMTLSWWQMALVASQESTWYGLVRSILALVCVFILFPITGIFLPFVTIGNDFETIYQIIQLPVVLIFMWILHIILQHLKRKGFRTDRFYTYFQVAIVLIGITICVFNNYERIQQWIEPYTDHHLTYNDFSEFCNRGFGINSQENNVLVDVECSQLIGQNVQWDGYVKTSKIVSVYNPILAILSFFPTIIARPLTCLLGKHFSTCSESYGCNVSSKLSDLCHVSEWNRYTYEIEIKMKNDGVWGSNGDTITLFTNSQDIIMDNATKSLRENDHIWFSGQLSGNKFGVLTAKNPFVKVSAIGCLVCSNLQMINNVRPKSFDDEFFKCAKRLIQFILYPIVLFK
ncbi:Wolframin family [Cinara cedri]|uniref:Wolframin family n=1 Tax=Cinara cedri TaxID=506608 RepID=A0A5E4M1D4_9HEMI|nr:Wolframin family [Cinara cedri]